MLVYKYYNWLGMDDVENQELSGQGRDQMGTRDDIPIIIKNNNTSIIEDAYLVAALVTLDPNVVYYPILNKTGRVAFEVKGVISDKLERLYAGETAPLEAFIGNHKKLRAAIFKLKNTYKKGQPSGRIDP